MECSEEAKSQWKAEGDHGRFFPEAVISVLQEDLWKT
jgi:hypothetical protein